MRLVLSVALVWANTALAAPPEAGSMDTGAVSVTTAPLVVEGDLPKTARARLETALREGLEGVGATARAVEGDACADAECLAAIEGTGHRIGVRVAVDGRDYTVKLVLVDVSGRATTTEAECQICGLEEAATLLRDQVAQLGPKLTAEEPSGLIVDSNPDGAQLYVDDALVGTTPYEGSVSAGPHQVRIERDGYIAQERELAAIAGGDERIDLALERVPRSRSQNFTIAGAALVAAGGTALAGGITLLVLNHRPVPSLCDGFDDNIDVNGLCRWRYDTMATGIGFTAAGGATAVAGAVLLGLAKKGGRTEVALSPRSVRVRVRF